LKVFISADIEGVSTTTTWDETNRAHGYYPMHAKQMTEEVIACIEGAKKAGATEIVVRDAHDSGCNIDPTRMPSGVSLLRNWSGNPYSMVEGIDESFDAAMFIGYHSSASRAGNPLSHTLSGKCNSIKINGKIASEFLIFSYACALVGVPTVFLSGDKMLCDDFKDLHPKLITCAVKDGIGSMTINYPPECTVSEIRQKSEQSLKQDMKAALVKLPKHFEIELSYKNHADCESASWFPNAKRKDDTVLTFETDDYFEVLRTLRWVL